MKFLSPHPSLGLQFWIYRQTNIKIAPTHTGIWILIRLIEISKSFNEIVIFDSEETQKNTHLKMWNLKMGRKGQKTIPGRGRWKRREAGPGVICIPFVRKISASSHKTCINV